MTTYNMIQKDITEAIRTLLYAQMRERIAEYILEDDSGDANNLIHNPVINDLIEYGKEYELAETDLEADGHRVNDDTISALLEKREVNFPL